MKKVKIKFYELGQSLFEVVIALALVALITTAVVSLATSSVKNSDYSKNNSVVTKYAQEAVEWVRQQRDENWNNVASRVTGSPITLGDLNTGWGSPAQIPGTAYNRQVTLSWKNPPTNTSIKVVATVTWTDGGDTYSVTSRTILTDWRSN